MGGAISKRTDRGEKGLGFTRGNEQLLNDLSSGVDEIVQSHPKEAKILFKTPMEWTSKLSESDFAATGFTSAGSNVKDSEGGEMFTFSNGKVQVSTLEYLSKTFQAAGSNRMREMQAALEGNPDPLAKIFGAAYAGGVDILEVQEKMNQEQGSNKQKEEANFRLLLLLNNLDMKLLHTSVEQMNKEVRINMESVNAEFKLLKAFSGPEDNHCLEFIDWESAYEFDNGLRSPPWRQVHGDLAYIVVKRTDAKERLVIMANMNGFWVIKGPEDDAMNYDKIGETYPTMVALLKANSPHFAENIDKQEFLYKPQEITTKKDTTDLYATMDKRNERKKNEKIASTSRQQSGDRRKSVAAMSQRTLQPSQKWANLGLTGDLSQTKKAKSTSRKTTKKKSQGSRQPSAARGGGMSARSSAYGFRGTARFDGLDELSSDSSDDDEELETRKKKAKDLPPEYWSIQKLVKYLSGGNETATIIALSSIRDFDLTSESCQFAVLDVGGLDILVNLLETDDVKCKIGALQILKDVSLSFDAKKAIADMNGTRPMVDILKNEKNQQLRCLAATTIANCAKLGRNRRMVRRSNGIETLVGLLDSPESPSGENELARCAALALWSCCTKSVKNKRRSFAAGVAPLLATLLNSENTPLLIPTLGIVDQCCSESEFRSDALRLGMIPSLVKHLGKEDKELQALCAGAIFECAVDSEPRVLIRKQEGLVPLIRLLEDKTNHDLVWAASGAIWKCSLDRQNAAIFVQNQVIGQLVGLLTEQEEDVLTNVSGALSELGKVPDANKSIKSASGISPLIDLLTGTNQNLLLNVTRALGQCAESIECMKDIDRLDGVRLIWSLLKSPNTELQAAAAWALCPCIKNAKDSGEMVRSFVGGLELIVSLLKSEDVEVQASVCAAISVIAKDRENLAVITDHSVVPMLSQLVETNDEQLQEHLAAAIGSCCAWGDNRVGFGENDAVAPLVSYLKSSKLSVQRCTAQALGELSKDPDNCITMHEEGVVKLLLPMVGSEDVPLQEASAGCISYIRKLALANEKAKYG